MGKNLPKSIVWSALILLIFACIGFVFLDEWLTHYIHSLQFLNHQLVKATLSYFRYVGTDKTFSFLYILLFAMVIYKWHMYKQISYKLLFVVLSLSITVSFAYCLGTFFEQYVPHLIAIAQHRKLEILNNPQTAFPAGHIARLVTLVTCLCMLYPKKLVYIISISITAILLIGLGLLFHSKYFFSGASIGILIGMIVPHYVKNLIFVQRIFFPRSSLNIVND